MYDRAIKCYRRTVELNPNDVEAWNNLGNAYAQKGDTENAIRAYTNALLVDPNYAEAWYNKARSHYVIGDFERAIAYAERAIELNPAIARRAQTWLPDAKNRYEVSKSYDEVKKERQKADQHENNESHKHN